ncbi:DUF1501 domain-containing protein [Chitinimonas taiwanensis]|uniref:DUF1501 domain-containing protein n=1 Tax=Chitinimonas taiwanensis TaxID=240412 RepID=UPI0035B38C6B
MKPFNASRREFLRASSALSLAGVGGAPFLMNLATMSAAAAANAPADYKALVCLFMSGGNDTHNMVLATDPTSFASYTQVRSTADAGSIAMAQNILLPISARDAQAKNAGRSFALHPRMGNIQNLFAAQRAAVIANVGPLLAPLNKAQWTARSVPTPPNLFSHNDQQSTWQAFAPEGALTGWGGRMADLLMSMNGTPLLTAVSTSGKATLLNANSAIQYQVTSSGAVAINGLNSNLYGSAAGSAALRRILTGGRSHLFEAEQAAITNRAIDLQAVLSTNMLPRYNATSAPNGIPDPAVVVNPATGNNIDNGLANQFQTVARMMGGASALGMRRQVFFVNIGGFDTHDNLNNTLNDLYARIDHAINYFDGVLESLGMRNMVTTFTASDFGRTLSSNGDGSDHGWGAHHFVFGGAVNGGDVYGRFPTIGVNTSDDVGSGRLLPALSVEQYAATLARWFGLSESQINDVFPRLVNFGSERDLGFMRA